MTAKDELARPLDELLHAYDPSAPKVTAEKLHDLWLRYQPKSIEVIKAEQRDKQETVGIPARSRVYR